MLEYALEYVRSGLPVVPLHSIREDGKCTCGNDTCSSPGKHPRTKNGLKDATTKASQVRQWWGPGQWPNASIAGVGGDYLCLDVDAKSAGHKSLKNLVADNSPLPDTAVALTGEYNGERGMHYWFSLPEGRQIASKIGIRPGIDIRCARGYAVLPPSPHVSGVNYEWVVPFAQIQEAPAWLLDIAPEAIIGESTWEPNPYFRQAKEIRDFFEGRHEVPPGEQREYLVRAARSTLTTGKSVDEVALLLYEGVDGNGGICACDQSREPWTFEEVLYIVEDVYRKPPTSAMQKDFSKEKYTWDDHGNAKRLVESYKDDHIFYVSDWGKWYLWDTDESRWVENSGSRLRQKWEGITKSLWDDAYDDPDKGWTRFINKCRSRSATDNAVVLARDKCEVSPSELNANPFLLNVKNGVLDLKSGELLPASPKLYLTKQVRAEYHPGKTSDLWNKVIMDLIPDPDLRLFTQKIFGYTLTGSTEEHKFFYFHGPPGSGKTTLLEAFAYLMGNYAEACEPSTFMLSRQEGGPTEDIARLSNARMVTTHEVEEGARWAEGRIAHLTGGDKVTARFLHQNSFEFYPQFKLFFSANHKPRVTGSAQSGLWRRLIIVPVDRVIPENQRDPMLQRKLRAPDVLDSMLAWAVEGCKLWMEDYKAGTLMAVPQLVKREVEDYKVESDHVLQFIQEVVTVTQDHKDRVPKPDMYALYRQWCTDNGRRQYNTANKFNREMQSQGFIWKPASYEKRVRECWMGVTTNKSLPKIGPRSAA